MKFDEFDPLYEMSWFDSSDTGLPDGIDIWLRSDPKNHGHSRYRVKVEKNKHYSGTFLVGSEPKLIDPHRSNLNSREIKVIQDFIKDHAQTLINHIDGKLTSGGCGRALQKQRGELGTDGMKTYIKE